MSILIIYRYKYLILSYNMNQLYNNNNIFGGKDNSWKGKRNRGIITMEQAEKKMNEFYNTDSKKANHAKLLDRMYRKKPKFTLYVCEDPDFVKCRQENPSNRIELQKRS